MRKRLLLAGPVSLVVLLALLVLDAAKIEEALMGLGSALWIAGELYAVAKGEDTTTSYVRRFMRVGLLGWIWRILIGGFTTWLWLHFNLGWV